jgi:hypothetical protein
VDPRNCTCHPSEAPVPCERKYAFSECLAAARARKGLQPATDWPLVETSMADWEAWAKEGEK